MSSSHLSLATLLFLALTPGARALTPPATSANASGHQATIQGTVFYDFDEDGVFNPAVAGEVPLVGWKVQIQFGGIAVAVFTDSNGMYSFVTPPGPVTYNIDSIAPPALPGGPAGFVGTQGGRWLPTSPIQVSGSSSASVIQADFGNLYLFNTPQFARSKLFWAFLGREALYPCDPVWRRAINNSCLRENFTTPNPAQQASTIFTVSLTESFGTVFQQLRMYMTQPANGVLAYKLSVQFLAAKLNTECGPLEGVTTYIEQVENGVLVPLSTMLANTLAVLCNPRSANTGRDSNDLAWKLIIEQSILEWTRMSSTGLTIYTKASQPELFPSPY